MNFTPNNSIHIPVLHIYYTYYILLHVCEFCSRYKLIRSPSPDTTRTYRNVLGHEMRATPTPCTVASFFVIWWNGACFIFAIVLGNVRQSLDSSKKFFNYNFNFLFVVAPY